MGRGLLAGAEDVEADFNNVVRLDILKGAGRLQAGDGADGGEFDALRDLLVGRAAGTATALPLHAAEISFLLGLALVNHGGFLGQKVQRQRRCGLRGEINGDDAAAANLDFAFNAQTVEHLTGALHGAFASEFFSGLNQFAQLFRINRAEGFFAVGAEAGDGGGGEAHDRGGLSQGVFKRGSDENFTGNDADGLRGQQPFDFGLRADDAGHRGNGPLLDHSDLLLNGGLLAGDEIAGGERQQGGRREGDPGGAEQAALGRSGHGVLPRDGPLLSPPSMITKTLAAACGNTSAEPPPPLAGSMTEYAIAQSAKAALKDPPLRARTEADAAQRAGGPVRFAVEMLPETYATAEAAYAAAPQLYENGGEVVFQDQAWRIVTRFWRPLPPLPIAGSPKEALEAPTGRARTQKEAEAAAGLPVQGVSVALPARYGSIPAARKKWGPLIDAGLADVEAKGDKFVVMIRFWRPTPPDLAAQEIAARLAAPLRARAPQASLDIGLFERRAPENPDVVLVAEEGSGRRQQE